MKEKHLSNRSSEGLKTNMKPNQSADKILRKIEKTALEIRLLTLNTQIETARLTEMAKKSEV